LGVWVNLNIPFEDNFGGAHHKKKQNKPYKDGGTPTWLALCQLTRVKALLFFLACSTMP